MNCRITLDSESISGAVAELNFYLRLGIDSRNLNCTMRPSNSLLRKGLDNVRCRGKDVLAKVIVEPQIIDVIP